MPAASSPPVLALPIGRRRLLAIGGAAAVFAACGSDSSSDPTVPATAGTTGTTGTTPSTTATTTSATATTTADVASTVEATSATTAAATSLAPFTASDFDALGTCLLLPETTAGPYPLEEQFDRRDITEDYPGRALRLGLRVIDDACTPIPGAAVEIWHCDATGDYSAFTDNGGGKDEGDGTTFFRGTQTAGDDGIVEFLTVVPGWYRGRAVHIHLRVHLADSTVLTSQLFFDADQLAAIYAEDAYVDNGLPDTSNDEDGIAGDVDEDGTLLALTDGDTTRGAGSVGLLNLGVDPSATSTGGSGGGPPSP